MGLPVGGQLQLVELSQDVLPLSPLPLLRETARQRRPEVVQAEAQTRAAQASVSIARIGRKPRLDTQFAFNISPNNAFNRSDWAIAANISMPLWDAGLTHSREMEAKSGVQSASANLEQVKKDVEAEVEEAHLNLVSARERLDAARLAVEAASVNLQQTQARYEQGIGGIDVVDLITAQVQFATASNNAINALYDVHLAQAQLNRAVGR
jgi:outer membrane protein